MFPQTREYFEGAGKTPDGLLRYRVGSRKIARLFEETRVIRQMDSPASEVLQGRTKGGSMADVKASIEACRIASTARCPERRNQMVRAAISPVGTDYARADATAFAEALVNYQQRWEDRTGFENWKDEWEPTVAKETDTA